MTASGVLPSLASSRRRGCGPASSKRARSDTNSSILAESGPTEIRNPRELFPVRDDFIRSAWVRRARTERAQEYEELYPYFCNRSPSADPCETSTSAAAAATATATAVAATPMPIPRTLPETTTATAPNRQRRRQQEPAVPPIKDPSKGATTASAASAAPPAASSAESRDAAGGHVRSQRQQHMGVGTGPRNVAELRRAFRRLEPENMFRAPRVEGEPIWAYWGGGRGNGADHGHGRGQGQPPLPPGKRASTKDGFVLVPARELDELRALEGALRKERGVLKAHCLVALNEGEVSAHRPLELTRMAVHDACGREMATALREYRVWARRNRDRDSDAPKTTSLATSSPMAITLVAGGGGGNGKRTREAASKERVTELRRTPAGWRTLRWVMMKRQAELKSQAAEATAMYSEEMEQRLKERYLEAWERRHDYDLYCVLAGQFWPLDAEAFRKCACPGKKLFLEIEAPARVITRMWKTYWPFRKDRKRKGCLGLQALWRGHHVRKRWRPIVRLRTHHGRRSTLRPCFTGWARLARVHRWARRRFEEIEGRWERACFHAWAEWTADLAAEKQRKLERAGRTLRNIAGYRAFRSWQFFTRTTRQAHNLYTRAVGGPAMDAWVRYLGEARRHRKRGGAAVTIQRHARGYLARGRYRATQTIIHGFNRLMSARRARQFLRQALATAHRIAAEELLQAGRDAEITAGVAREEKRLAKMQKELSAADAAVRRAVTGRLNAGRLSPSTLLKGRPMSRGGGELKREERAVREEWKEQEATTAAAAAAAAALGKKTTTSFVEGKPEGGGGGGGSSHGLGKTWPRLGMSMFSRKGVPRDASTADNGAGFSSTHPAPAAAANKTAAATAKPTISHTTEEVEREARGRILRRNRELAREIVAHDFDVRNPPPLTCCAPGCRRTFTRDEHYLAHWDAAAGDSAEKERPPPQQHETGSSSRPPSPSAASPGTRSQPPRRKQRDARAGGATTPSRPSTLTGLARPPTPAEAEAGAEAGHPELGGEGVASFHLVVASKVEEGVRRERSELEDGGVVSGFDLLLAYITRVWGHGQAYNTLLFVDAVESWRRRYLTTDPGFVEGAVRLRREYVCYGAPREARLADDTRRDLMRVLGTLPDDDLDDTEEGAQDEAGGGGEIDGGGNGGEKRHGRSGSVDKNGGPKGTAHSDASSKPGRNKVPVPATALSKQHRRVMGLSAGASAAAAAAVATAAATAAADPAGLRPTSFDEAQFQALAHLSRVVGPGFLASDLGRRATVLRLQDLKQKREAAHEIVRLERRSRLANEAAEIRKLLSRDRDMERAALAQSALDGASESVVEALLRSAVAGVEMLEMRELEAVREEEMVAEAATVEAVWVVEPPLLEYLLDQEVSAYCSETVEQELMAEEDDWVLPEVRMADFLKGFKTAMVCAFDLNSVPGGEEGARQAATTIQLSWRQRSARVEARRRLAQVYVKRAGAEPGEVYYEHTVTGVCQWERPLIAYRLFPYSNW